MYWLFLYRRAGGDGVVFGDGGIDLGDSPLVSSSGFACMCVSVWVGAVLDVTCCSGPVALAAAIAVAEAGTVSGVGIGPPSGGGVFS